MNQKIYDLKWEIIIELSTPEVDNFQPWAKQQETLEELIIKEFDLPETTVQNIFDRFNDIFPDEYSGQLCNDFKEYQLPLLKRLVAEKYEK